jgi:RNA polymerase sigma factor (sigma-70 family)
MAELAEILEGCKQGKSKYQEMLYRKYSGLTYGICLRFARNDFDARDIMQEGWVKIFRHIASYSQDNSFEGWIRRIMINTAITLYRKNLKHAYQEDITDVAYTKYDRDQFDDLDYTQEEMMAAIKELPAGYGMVFNMYVIDGYKHKEIADMLGIDINTSKSQLSRAKKYLQRELSKLSEVNM